MTNFFINIGPIFSELEKGLLVLTPNHRTSVQLHESYGSHLKQNRLPLVCNSPKIFPVDIWVHDLWNELVNNNISNVSSNFNNAISSQNILTPIQESLIWQEIITQSSVGEKLLNPQATAKSAQEAYRNILQWEIPLSEIHLFTTSTLLNNSACQDTDIFLQWLADYEKRLIQENSINLAQLLPKFITALDLEIVNLPEKILLLGFDNPPPLYKTLFLTIQKHNEKLSFQSLQKFSPTVTKVSYADTQEELLVAADWSNNILKKQPNAKIAIICPDLHSRTNEINRVFTQNFNPNSILFDDQQLNTCFSTTASTMLNKTPIIETALSLLTLDSRTLPTLDICMLLRSAFILSADSEADSRAALELHLRRNAEMKVYLSDLRSFASDESRPWYSPHLAKALIEIEKLHKHNKSKRNTSDWLPIIEQHLTLIGWPGNKEYRPTELQTLENWQVLLKDFCELGFIYGKISFQKALKLIKQLASQSTSVPFFNQSPVQILSPIEAAGLQFSHLWFMGLCEQNWPQPRRPNPFIPISIQKKYSLPDTTPELQYDTALAILHQFFDNTRDTIVFSYPLQSDDITLKPSILLQEFHSTDNIELLHSNIIGQSNLHPFSQSLLLNKEAPLPIESYSESINISIMNDEVLSGGSKLIADQAACPFKNFAIQRLKAKELPALPFGLPPFEVGNMLHCALEIMWQQLKNQDSLKALNSSQQQNICLEAAQSAVKTSAKRFPHTMTVQYCHLEVQRLKKLLFQWLAEELKRDFFHIVEHEHMLQWRYSTLQLNLRVDRIEQFSDNSFGIVDYKSSKNNNTINWLESRQDKPQILLYLQAAEQSHNFPQVSSMLYAQVNIEEMRYKGLTATANAYPGVSLEQHKKIAESMSWQELKVFWQQSLEKIAQEFLSGYIAIDPKHNSSCQYCHLDALCRIQEKNQAL